MKKRNNLGIQHLVFIVLSLLCTSSCSTLSSSNVKMDLINNYVSNIASITDLKNYFNSIVPKNTRVEIEFKNNSELDRFGIYTIDTVAGFPATSTYLKWDLNVKSNEVISKIKSLGWTEETLAMLKQKLDLANCIQIESGEPTKIGFRRSGMGMYSYNYFTNPIPDSLKKNYNDSCTYIYFNKNLVLEYEGGAIGSQCFPDKK